MAEAAKHMERGEDVVESEFVDSKNIPYRIYYPKNLDELVMVSKRLAENAAQRAYEYMRVYPIISMKKVEGDIQPGVMINLIPSNICDARDVLEYTYPESTKYPISGASEIYVDSVRCPIPKEELIDYLDTLKTSEEFTSILDVHCDILHFLKDYYNLPNNVNTDRPYNRGAMMRETSMNFGARLGSFESAYVFLVTQFCLHNPLLNKVSFIAAGNTGLRLFVADEFFFADVFEYSSPVTTGFVDKDGYLIRGVTRAKDWVDGINRALENDAPFFSSETLNETFSEEYVAKNSKLLFETVYYGNKFNVICKTLEDFERLKEVVREIKEGKDYLHLSESTLDGILNMGLFFKDTPELSRTYRLELLKQGVSSHLRLTVGGIL